MNAWLGNSILLFVSVLQNAAAADLVFAPIGPFGEPLKGCHVEKLSPRIPTGRDGQEFASAFRGLAARGVPLGEYETSVRCGDRVVNAQVLLKSEHQFEPIVRRERVLVSEPTKPKLVIKVERQDSPGLWWIELIGLFNHQRYNSEVEADGREASVTDPETGSYFVLVQSSDGYSCGGRIDLTEFTRRWSFDPSECTFHVDQFAYVINGSDSAGRDRWRAEMRTQEDQLIQILREAAGKEPALK